MGLIKVIDTDTLSAICDRHADLFVTITATAAVDYYCQCCLHIGMFCMCGVRKAGCCSRLILAVLPAYWHG